VETPIEVSMILTQHKSLPLGPVHTLARAYRYHPTRHTRMSYSCRDICHRNTARRSRKYHLNEHKEGKS